MRNYCIRCSVLRLICICMTVLLCSCDLMHPRTEASPEDIRYLDGAVFKEFSAFVPEGIYISRPVPHISFVSFQEFHDFITEENHDYLSEYEKYMLYYMSQEFENRLIPLPDEDEFHYIRFADAAISRIKWYGGERYTVCANVSLPTGSFTYRTSSYMLENETDLFINAKNDPLDSVTHIDTFTQDGIPYTIHRGLGYHQYYEVAFWTYVSVHGTFYVEQKKFAETEEDLAVVPFESTHILWQSGETFYKIIIEDSSQITVTTDYLDSFEIINTTAE